MSYSCLIFVIVYLCLYSCRVFVLSSYMSEACEVVMSYYIIPCLYYLKLLLYSCLIFVFLFVYIYIYIYIFLFL